MIYLILGAIVFVIVLSIIVMIHEGGHFFFAKKAGILCHEFSIGMGPCIKQVKKGETTYSIRAIPFGGYVAMAGEEIEYDILKNVKKVKLVFDEQVPAGITPRVKVISSVLDNPNYENLATYTLLSYDLAGSMEALEDELFVEVEAEDGTVSKFIVNRDCMYNGVKKEELQIAPKNRVFTNKPLGARLISVFAGPMMNFVLALIVFFLMGLIYGYADTSSTKVKDVSGAALEAGIVDGDMIYTINGNVLKDWNDLSYVMDEAAKGAINQDGTLNVSYYVGADKSNLKDVVLQPTILIYSMEMILDTSTKKVLVGDYGEQMKETKAYLGGLRVGDEIYKVGIKGSNQTKEIKGVSDLLAFMTSEACQKAATLEVYVLRSVDGVKTSETANVEIYSKSMLEASNITQTRVVMGVSTGNSRDFVKILYMPFVNTGKASIQIFKTLALFGQKGSGIKLTDLSGPAGILNLFVNLVKGEDAFYNILYWTGLLTVNIGIFNLLPIPALDGCRILFLLYEGVTKKKPNAKVEAIINNVGFILLMGLFVVIFISDIVKCF